MNPTEIANALTERLSAPTAVVERINALGRNLSREAIQEALAAAREILRAIVEARASIRQEQLPSEQENARHLRLTLDKMERFFSGQERSLAARLRQSASSFRSCR